MNVANKLNESFIYFVHDGLKVIFRSVFHNVFNFCFTVTLPSREPGKLVISPNIRLKIMITKKSMVSLDEPLDDSDLGCSSPQQEYSVISIADQGATEYIFNNISEMA